MSRCPEIEMYIKLQEKEKKMIPVSVVIVAVICFTAYIITCKITSYLTQRDSMQYQLFASETALKTQVVMEQMGMQSDGKGGVKKKAKKEKAFGFAAVDGGTAADVDAT